MKNTDKSNNPKEVKITNSPPIEIINIDNENRVWLWIKRIGGLLGIILTTVVLTDSLFSKPKVSIKPISFASNSGTFYFPSSTDSGKVDTIFGVKYFLKLSMKITNEDLNFKDVKVMGRYKNGRIFNGEFYYPGRHFRTWRISDEIFILDIPQDELLYYKTNLEKNKTHLNYITFIVRDSSRSIKDPRPSHMRLEFVLSKRKPYRNSNKSIKIPKFEIENENEMTFIFDSNLWRRINK